MVIVDTSIWIDFLNEKSTPETLWLRSVGSRKKIGLTTLILTEVLQGVRFDRRFREAESLFRKLSVISGLSGQIAVQAAQNYRTLCRLGVTPRSTIDCLIATVCIVGDHELLHCDKDFGHFARHLGLRIIDPLPS